MNLVSVIVEKWEIYLYVMGGKYSRSIFFLLLRWPSSESVHLGSCRLGFDSESGQTNDFKIGIHSFAARRSALGGQCEEQAGKFTCAVGKGT